MDLTLVNNICQIQNRDAADYTHNQKKKKKEALDFYLSCYEAGDNFGKRRVRILTTRWQ